MKARLANNEVRLIIADSDTSADMLYATQFHAPDPFVYLEFAGEKAILVSQLEIGRARRQAEVDRIFSYAELEARWLSEHVSRSAASAPNPPRRCEILSLLLRDLGVSRLIVPESFPLGAAHELEELGFTITAQPDPFFPERVVKRPDEIEKIAAVLRKTEQAMAAAIARITAAEIADARLIYDGQPLTSEGLRAFIAVRLMELGCLARNTIVAVGDQGCDPHHAGDGLLRPDTTIVIDVFPRDLVSHYYADISRTVVRGRASDAVHRMYAAVAAAQEVAYRNIRAGVDASDVHAAVAQSFLDLGFHNGTDASSPEGFFHGTGHGLGLELHEAPRLYRHHHTLQAGEVVTVEPGLYYRGNGAVRLEDLVVVADGGCRNLTTLPKILEL
ncbi:MAG: aminopeptidase P family protein [Candidatus Schekmanbacteria bacterium]|nr:aminopeptidase P family protein [Candidatus Schekmanbacteria bacterium]